LISLEALRQDHLGCYGYFRDTSVNLDKLAGESIVFTNAITAANWTIPSHMTILTGLYPLEAGFIPGGLLNAKSFIADNITTLAQYLRKYGYYTLGVHGGGYVSEFYGFDKGFSDYIKGSKDAAKGIEVIQDNLRCHRDRKFFIFFHTLEIHWPYIRDFYLKDLPAVSSSKENAIARYDSGIKYADHYLGKLFDWMGNNGLYKNTIIIVLSDHGETFRLIKEKSSISSSGSHGSTLHEDEIKIPFIFRIPELKGRKIEYQIATVDILPTILDYLDIEPDNDLRGISLIPLMKENEFPKPRFAYIEATNSNKKLQSIRSNDFKLISSSSSVLSMTNGKHNGYRFVDLKNDPDEMRNLFKEKHQLAQSYVGFLQRLLASIRSNMIKLKQSDQDTQIENKELEEQLKGLGYIGN
jgi:arylsulfatase A-like enzyme